MIRRNSAAPAVLAFAAVILSASFFDVRAEEASKEEVFQQQLEPLLQRYCLDCHAAGEPEGDFNLAAFKNARLILEHRQTWLKLMQRVSFGDMPPEEGEELPDAERKKMLDAIDELINRIDCTQQSDPGQVTIRRLNRFEYRNTIRDLLGVDYSPAESFPGDDVGYGFDNIGDVMSLPTLLMEKYLAAAEEISQEAIPAAVQEKDLRMVIKGRDFKGRMEKEYFDDDDGKIITGVGQISKRFNIPENGKYEFKLYAYGQFAGDELPKLTFDIDGKEQRRLEIEEPQSKPREIAMTVELTKGRHQVAVGFLNDFYNPDAKDRNQRDRNLVVSRLIISGPVDRKVQDSAEESELIFVRPKSKADIREASYKVLQRLASRAYRRPVTREEVRRLQQIVAMVIKDGGSYDDGIRLALQAVLVSPHFLFKIEQPPEADSVRTLNDYELAVSLSYFLWSSMPDDQLFRVSHRDQLHEGENLKSEIARMLKDEKSHAMTKNFGLQWLQLRNLNDIEPDQRMFPEFDEELRDAMYRETELLFQEIINDDLSIFTLLTADFTFVNEKLAKHYELLNVQGDKFRRVSLKATNRRGLLTHASLLTITSNPTRTSPVKRGKWVLENLLGAPPPPPAPDVMPLEDQELTGTLREQMKQHRENPSCASCHAGMDPIGFALENFDAVGRWREKDGGSLIDPQGTLPDGSSFSGAIELQNVLSRARRENFARCFAEKMLTYALGRGLDYYDQCAVIKIVETAREQDYRYSAFVRAVVMSEPFQKRRNRSIEE